MSVTLTHKNKTQTFDGPYGPAFRAARAIVGVNPIDEGEGLVTSRWEREEEEDEPLTLRFTGCTFEELFPPVCEECASIPNDVKFDTKLLLHLCPSCKKRLHNRKK